MVICCHHLIVSWWLLNVIVSWWLLIVIVSCWLWLWADDCWMVVPDFLAQKQSRFPFKLQTPTECATCYLVEVFHRGWRKKWQFTTHLYTKTSMQKCMHVPSAGVWKKIKCKKACTFAYAHCKKFDDLSTCTHMHTCSHTNTHSIQCPNRSRLFWSAAWAPMCDFRGKPVSSFFCGLLFHWFLLLRMMYLTMFTTCLDFGSNTWEISAWLPAGWCK